MAMSVGSGSGDADVMVEINTTPLIDVMLVLLIMLIITIPIQTHAVKLNMPVPNPNQQQQKPPEVVDIVVDFDGTIGWNGAVISSDADLLNRLKAIGMQPTEQQPEVHLRPNKLVNYKYVAHIMAAAQRSGVTKIGLVGNEQFM
jgi:biopolymer transport protein ExbD